MCLTVVAGVLFSIGNTGLKKVKIVTMLTEGRDRIAYMNRRTKSDCIYAQLCHVPLQFSTKPLKA